MLILGLIDRVNFNILPQVVFARKKTVLIPMTVLMPTFYVEAPL